MATRNEEQKAIRAYRQARKHAFHMNRLCNEAEDHHRKMREATQEAINASCAAERKMLEVLGSV